MADTYIALGNLSEADVTAIFNNRTTGAVEIDINIFTIMHSDLPRCHHNDAVLNSSDVSSTCDMTCNDQRLFNVLQCKSSEWGTICSGHRHINNASIQPGERARRCGTGCRGRKDDVESIVTRDIDICCFRETWFSD